MKAPRSAFAKAIESVLMHKNIRKAIVYVSPSMVVKATRFHKPRGRSYQTTLVVTFGTPGYQELAFIKKCKKAGQSFPIRAAQLRFYR